LYWSPNENILVVSASRERSDAFSIFTQKLIRDIDWLSPLLPKEEEGQRKSMIAFDVGPSGASHAPSVKSVGIFGSSTTGSRSDCLIADDVESLANSDTPLKRDKLAEVVKEFDAISKPGGHIVYLGTPQSEESIYKHLPERGYTVRVWPSRFPKEEKVASYNGVNRDLSPFIKDQLVVDEVYQKHLEWEPCDTRFDELDLSERYASYGRVGYSLQFQLDTSLSDAEKYPLRCSDLIVMPLDPFKAPERVLWTGDASHRLKNLECVGLAGDGFQKPFMVEGDWQPYEGAIMSVDPAGRGKDDCGVAVIKQRLGRLYLTAWDNFAGGYDTATLEKIARIAKEQQVKRIVVESNFGDGMFNSLLEPILSRIYPIQLEEVRHSKQKEMRIADCLEPVISGHLLVIDEALVTKDYASRPDLPFENRLRRMGLYQLSRLTRQKGSLVHDDKIDALAMAVNCWQDSLKVSETKALSRLRDREWDEVMSHFMKDPRRAGRTWLDASTH
jgi:hypothetical protein